MNSERRERLEHARDGLLACACRIGTRRRGESASAYARQRRELDVVTVAATLVRTQPVSPRTVAAAVVLGRLGPTLVFASTP